MVLLAASQHGVKVHSYAPRLIKATVAGYGNADKHHVQVMVRSLLGMTETPEPADAADALAVALCHIQNEQFQARFALPPASGARSSRIVRGATARCVDADTPRVQPSR